MTDKGFGSCRDGDADIIRCITSSHHWFRDYDIHEFVDYQRNEWDERYLAKVYEKPASPLSSYKKEFSYHLYPDACANSATHAHLQVVLFATKGFWSLMVTREAGTYDFTVCVRVGDGYHFHPQSIRKSFFRWHRDSGKALVEYENWKKMVLRDLDSARFLLGSFVPPKHMMSITSSPSSERLCRKIGLPVRDGVAFWLKQSDTYNNIVPLSQRIIIPSQPQLLRKHQA